MLKPWAHWDLCVLGHFPLFLSAVPQGKESELASQAHLPPPPLLTFHGQGPRLCEAVLPFLLPGVPVLPCSPGKPVVIPLNPDLIGNSSWYSHPCLPTGPRPSSPALPFPPHLIEIFWNSVVPTSILQTRAYLRAEAVSFISLAPCMVSVSGANGQQHLSAHCPPGHS